jgi:hypothetical protein
MNRRTVWVVVGLVAFGCLAAGVASLFAQRFGPPADGRGGEVGRYVVVRNTDDGIIIMDTTTGDLYKATPADLKPFAARPHAGWGDKDKPPFADKAPIDDKPLFPTKEKPAAFDKDKPTFPEKDKPSAADKDKFPNKDKEKP